LKFVKKVASELCGSAQQLSDDPSGGLGNLGRRGGSGAVPQSPEECYLTVRPAHDSAFYASLSARLAIVLRE